MSIQHASENPAGGGPLLFLDGSGVTPRVGIWQARRWLAYRETTTPALAALPANTQAVLGEARLAWPEVGGFLFVAGPGAVLGPRLAAMAVRAWQADDIAARPKHAARPVWAGGSLPLAAALALAGGAAPPFFVATHARQNSWHVLEVSAADPALLASASVRTLGGAELAQISDPLFLVPARQHGGAPPPHARALPASLGDHPQVIATPGLFRPAATATPFLGEEPQYRRWEGAADSP